MDLSERRIPDGTSSAPLEDDVTMRYLYMWGMAA